MTILSVNDYRQLSSALSRMEEVTLSRSYRGVTVTAQTMQVSKPWPVAMIVQIRVARPGVEWRQSFESVEEVKKAIDRENVL